MSTQLLQIVRFTAVGAGSTVSLPHTLNIADVPVKPDLLAPSVGGFTMTADAAQVTVTNNGSAPADIDVWTQRVHSIPRELGAPIDHMVPQPFVIACDCTGGGGPTAPTVERITPAGGPPHTGVIDPTIDVTYIEGTGAASTLTLDDGTEDGFEKTIYGYDTDGGILITPTHLADGTSILIASGSNGGFILKWDETAGHWVLVGQGANLTINP